MRNWFQQHRSSVSRDVALVVSTGLIGMTKEARTHFAGSCNCTRRASSSGAGRNSFRQLCGPATKCKNRHGGGVIHERFGYEPEHSVGAGETKCWRRQEARQRGSGGRFRLWYHKATREVQDISTSYEVAPRMGRSGTLHSRRNAALCSGQLDCSDVEHKSSYDPPFALSIVGQLES